MTLFPGASPIDIGEAKDGKRIILTPKDRSNHMHVVGSTDTGKSTLLERMIRKDIAAGHGLCLVDPSSSLYRKVLGWIATYGYDRSRQIHLIDPAAQGWRVGFNPLWAPTGDVNEMFDSVDLVLDAFAQAMGGEDTLSMPRFVKVCSALTFALAAKRLTLLDAFEMIPIHRTAHREWLAAGTPDRLVRSVWEELNALNLPRHQHKLSEQFESTFNRMFDVLKAPALRAMVGQMEHVIDFRTAMDRGDIVLVNLGRSRGFSRQAGDALGRMLINAMFNAALEREADAARPFYLYVDECHRYVTEDVEGILTECRKFGLHVTLAHQYLKQLELVSERFFHAVMTQARIKVVFSVGRSDAKLLADEILADQYDLEKPKRSLDKPTVVGFGRVLLRHHMRTKTEARSETDSEGEGEVIHEAVATSELFGSGQVTTFDADNNPVAAVLATNAASGRVVSTGRGTSQHHGRSTSSSLAQSDAEGEGEALEPILEWMHTALHTVEELNHLAAVELQKQGTGHAAVKVVTRPTQWMRTIAIEKTAPRPELLSAAIQRITEWSEFTSSTAAVEKEIDARVGWIEEEVRCFNLVAEPEPNTTVSSLGGSSDAAFAAFAARVKRRRPIKGKEPEDKD